jgi:hypothetical protein
MSSLSALNAGSGCHCVLRSCELDLYGTSGSADSLAKGRSVRFRNVIVFLLALSLVGACCAAFVILIGEMKRASELKLAAAQKSDQITDIWINRMQGSFFVFLPDNTAKIYESYSFDLINVGKWQRVEDRPVYPESPGIGLASYKAEFDGARVTNIYIYPIFHHDSIVIEDNIIGHRGFNRLSDTDDPNGFYHRKFKQGLPQDLSIVDRYWESHNGRPSH